MTILDLSPSFFDAWKAMCARLGAHPIDLASVCFSESGMRAEAHNPAGHASGLNQLMPATAHGLGWDTAGDPTLTLYRKLSPEGQLPWVERYYSAYKGRLLSIGHIYTATFVPAQLAVDLPPEKVITAHGGPYGFAYEANMCFDANHDGIITVQELTDAVMRNCHGDRWQTILTTLTGAAAPVAPVPALYDVRTALGLQQACNALGYPAGAEDGLLGAATRAGVFAFQSAHPPLVADGVAGPLTRNELILALRKIGALPAEV